MPDTAESKAREVNRLYWETDQSVADIAQQLDISRRALYSAVEPHPAGLTCDVCGGELEFENRSARSAGQTVCRTCAAAEAPEQNDHATAAYDEVPADPVADDGAPAVLAGAALAGAVIGAVLTLAVVPRR